jgi:hypothetical protein
MWKGISGLDLGRVVISCEPDIETSGNFLAGLLTISSSRRDLLRGVSSPNFKYLTPVKLYRKFSSDCKLMLHVGGGFLLMVACNVSTTPLCSDPPLLAPCWCPLMLTHFTDWLNNMTCLQSIYPSKQPCYVPYTLTPLSLRHSGSSGCGWRKRSTDVEGDCEYIE